MQCKKQPVEVGAMLGQVKTILIDLADGWAERVERKAGRE
jgi:hypothetical protein